MSSTAHSKESKNFNKVWIIALAIVCLGIIGHGQFYSSNTRSNLPYLAGENLVYALVFWAGFHAVFLREHGARISANAFAAIYMALIASALIAASRNEKEAIQMITSVQEEMTRIASSATNSNDLPVPISQKRLAAPSSSGAVGELERWIKDIMDRMVAHRNDYLMELDTIGWNSMLDAQRIQSDTGLSDSKTIIEKAKQIVDKYEKKTYVLVQSAKKQINELKVSEPTKKRMLVGFNEGVNKGRIERQWKLERQAIAQFEQIITLLNSSSKWEVSDDQILFYSQDQLEQYNMYMQSIRGIVRQQMELQKRGFEEANQYLESAKDHIER